MKLIKKAWLKIFLTLLTMILCLLGFSIKNLYATQWIRNQNLAATPYDKNIKERITSLSDENTETTDPYSYILNRLKKGDLHSNQPLVVKEIIRPHKGIEKLWKVKDRKYGGYIYVLKRNEKIDEKHTILERFAKLYTDFSKPYGIGALNNYVWLPDVESLNNRIWSIHGEDVKLSFWADKEAKRAKYADIERNFMEGKWVMNNNEGNLDEFLHDINIHLPGALILINLDKSFLQPIQSTHLLDAIRKDDELAGTFSGEKNWNDFRRMIRRKLISTYVGFEVSTLFISSQSIHLNSYPKSWKKISTPKKEVDDRADFRLPAGLEDLNNLNIHSTIRRIETWLQEKGLWEPLESSDLRKRLKIHYDKALKNEVSGFNIKHQFEAIVKMLGVDWYDTDSDFFLSPYQSA